jgi:hypothetical protein
MQSSMLSAASGSDTSGGAVERASRYKATQTVLCQSCPIAPQPFTKAFGGILGAKDQASANRRYPVLRSGF